MIEIKDTRPNFRCYYCGQIKAIRHLADILLKKVDLSGIKKSIQSKEELREEYRKQILASDDDYVKKTLNQKVLELEKAIAELQKQANTSKNEVCNTCVVQGRGRVAGETFTCDFCQQTKNGTGIKQHIVGWETRGIYPQNIMTVCRECDDNYAFTAPENFYCPRTSDGRDDYSLNGKMVNKFDCNCPEQENVLPQRPFKGIFD